MPFYGDSSDLKLAGTRIVIAELVIPIILFTISAGFLVTWVFLHGISTQDLIDFDKIRTLGEDYYLIVISEVVMIYSFLDLLLACFLYSAVVRLKCSMCLVWIIFQVILLVALTLPCFICPFVVLGLSSIFWQWVTVCCVVYLYKIYRIRIICFLITEMKEEGRVWKKYDETMYE